MKFMVIGQYCWGKADTEAKALKKARSIGGKEGVKRYLVYEVSDETYLNDMGDMCRNHDSPMPRLLKRVVGKKIEVVEHDKCQAFLQCKNPATTTLHNSIVGDVPCCERCKDRLEE